MTFTYTGPSVAAAVVAGVFNDALAQAEAMRAEANSEFSAAREQIAAIPFSFAGDLTSPAIQFRTIDIGQLLAQQEALAGAADARAGMLSGLVAEMDSFLNTYFPGTADGVRAARDALVTILGGANFANGREAAALRTQQAAARQERTRVQQEEDEIARWAALGYQQPPGELHHRLDMMRRDDMHGVADTSMEADASELARERAALERTLRMLTGMRAQALQAFSSYLAAYCAASYEVGTARTEAANRETVMLMDRMQELQSATNRAAALQIRAGESDYAVGRQYLTGMDRIAEQQASAQVATAITMAKALGSMAAQALNNMRGTASIGGNEEMNDIVV